jgi:hypothetical protein
MKYKFENYNIEIIDPVIVRLQYTGEHGSKEIRTFATLQTPDGSRFGGIDLGVFVYAEPYTDEQLLAWAFAELENYRVK